MVEVSGVAAFERGIDAFPVLTRGDGRVGEELKVVRKGGRKEEMEKMAVGTIIRMTGAAVGGVNVESAERGSCVLRKKKIRKMRKKDPMGKF
jgi:hypothetical protein